MPTQERMSTNPLTARERPAACPSCGATVRADVSWCGLCYASLRPEVSADEPAAQPTSVADPAAGAAAFDVVSSKVAGPDVEAIADRLLAELAASRDPAPSWVGRLPRSAAGKAGLIAAGAVIGALVLVAVMSLLGLVL